MEKENVSVFAIKKKSVRKLNWSDEEISCLIYFWRENYEDLIRQKRNRIVYDLISANLHESGFQRTSDEIQKKISNLFTRDEKSACSKTGASPSKWAYYYSLNEFLATNPLHNTSQLKESYIPHCSTSGSQRSVQEDHQQQQFNSQGTDLINYAEAIEENELLSTNTEIESEISLSQASSCRIADDHVYLKCPSASQQSNSNIQNNSITETPKQGKKRTTESNGTSSGKKKRLTYEERMLQCLENTSDLILKNQERIISVMETQNYILKRMFPK